MPRLLLLSLCLLLAGCGPSEAELKARREAEARRQAEEKEKREAQEKAAREAQLQNALAQGKQAMEEKRFEDAVKHYSEATRLQDDTPTQELLKDARQQLALKREAAFKLAIDLGRNARKEKLYADARAAFLEALRNKPEDADTLKDLAETEYLLYFTRGQASYDAGRYSEAIKDVQESLKRQPADSLALTLLSQAKTKRHEQVIVLGRAALDKIDYPLAIQCFTEAKQLNNTTEVDALLTEAQFQNEKRQGRLLLEQKKYALAIERLKAALRYVGDDPSTREMLKQANEGKMLQDRAEYERLIKAGEAAMNARNYPQAIKAFRDALVKMPNDAAAKSYLAAAEKEQARKESYDRHMLAGKGQMTARNYAAAEASFLAAQTEMPGDNQARLAMQEARTMKAKKTSYDSHMSMGNAHLAAKNYAGAIHEYNQAKFDFPGDSAATAALTRAQAAQASSMTKKR